MGPIVARNSLIVPPANFMTTNSIDRRAVLWDLDGTLADTEEYHWLAWQQVMQREGLVIPHRQFLETFGQRNRTVLTAWLGAETPLDRIDAVGDAKEALFREIVANEGLTALPGGVVWTERLREQGWRQAIATSAPLANAVTMLEALGIADGFDALVSSEDVSAGKPDPEVFEKAALRVDVPAARCIVVEDAPAGVEAARRARMTSIGVRAAGAPLDATLFTRSLATLAPETFDRVLGTDGRLTADADDNPCRRADGTLRSG